MRAFQLVLLSLPRKVVGPRAEPEDARHGGDHGRDEESRADPGSDEKRRQSEYPDEDGGEKDHYAHGPYFPRDASAQNRTR